MDDSPSFGRSLRRRRRVLDLTQEELARRAGYSASAIRKVESDVLRPSREMAERLADVLGLPPEQRPQFVRVARAVSSDLPRPVSVSDLDADLHPSSPPRHNLPAFRDSFVGRGHETGYLKTQLASNRLVTVTGSGGVGKSALALRTAADLEPCYPDGVWLAEFASLADPVLVPRAVAFALGIHEVATESVVATLARALRVRQMLLVLDNCEHLLEAAAQLADALLVSCPNLRILATSRQALGIAGEVVWPVPALSVPPESRCTLDELSQYGSVRLFVDRARANLPSFALTRQNAPSVAKACRLLGGMPLAIELAAARARVLTPEQIGERLGDQLELLTRGSRTAHPRQQTLKATIDWSHDLLAEPERALFRRLSVFSGGFSLDAAEVVCSDERSDGRQVLDLLTSLVDKSLVQVETEGDRARYWLLEPIRQYAQRRLEEAGELDAVRARHRDWYLALAEAAEPKLFGSGQRASLDQLEAEHDNLRAALGWCLDRGDTQAGLRLVAGLGHFWWLRAYFSEGRRWLEAMLGVSDERTALRAKVLELLGVHARQQGDFDSATAHFAESLDILGHVEDGRRKASVLCSGAYVLEARGDPGRAEAQVREALSLFREEEDEWGIWRALNSLGGMAAKKGDLESAHVLLDEALRHAHRLGNSTALGFTYNNLANAARSAGDAESARDFLEHSLRHFQEIGERQQIGMALRAQAYLAIAQSDHARAAALLAESLALSRQSGDQYSAGRCLYLSAALANRKGTPERAARLLGAADVILINLDQTERTEYDLVQANGRANLGEAAFARRYAEGQTMTLEQAVEYALQGLDGEHGV